MPHEASLLTLLAAGADAVVLAERELAYSMAEMVTGSELPAREA